MKERWIASRSLSSGAHSRDPVARNDGSRATASTNTFALAALCARGLLKKSRANQRARGMPDARCTRGLACKTGNENAHEHTGSAEAIRHSLRNGFTAYNALSPATN